jgi:hypothetical protein
MEAGAPMHMMMYVLIYFVGSIMRPNRQRAWWSLAFLFTFPLVISAWVRYFPHRGYGFIGVCVWFVVWYIGFAGMLQRTTHQSAEWYSQYKHKLIWWTRFTAVFLCGFSLAIAVSAIGTTPPMANVWIVLPAILLFVGVSALLAKLSGSSGTKSGGNVEAEQPYQVPCKDLNNFTAYELANSFDHTGLQMTAAINTLQSAGLNYLNELLEIEKALLSRQAISARNIKVVIAASAFALVIAIFCDGQPAYFNGVLCFLIFMLILLLILGVRFPFMPSMEHADSIAALSYIPSSKVIPALIRGWTTYYDHVGYDFHAERFAGALLERLRSLSPGETVSLDDLTTRKLIRCLTLLYDFGGTIKPIKTEVSVQLIGMPGTTENQDMKRFLTKVAEGTGNNKARSEIEYAARLALMNRGAL